MEETIKKNILVCLIGTTGKTDAIIDFIPEWINQNTDGEIFVFDPMARIIPTFPEKIKLSIDNDKEFKWVDYLIDKCKNDEVANRKPKLLVLNGGDILFPTPKEKDSFPADKMDVLHGGLKLGRRPPLHPKFMDLLMLKRRLNMDIIITFQDPEVIPIRLSYFISDFITLPVTTDYVPDNKMPISETLEACITAITAYHVDHNGNPSKEFLRYAVESGEVSSNLDRKRLGEIIDAFPKVKKLLMV